MNIVENKHLSEPISLQGRVLASLAGELDSLVEIVADREVSARIGQAGKLVRWVESAITTDPTYESDLSKSLSRLLANDADSSQVGDYVRRIVQARSNSRDLPDVASSESTAVRLPSPEEVANYLRMTRQQDDAKIHSVRAMTGGFSKRTFLVEATMDGTRQELVFRQVPPSRRAGSLLPEFSVLRHVHDAGVPTPEPLWIEPEENALGGAFFVTRRALGRTVGDVWGADGVSKELCLEVARLYARLHQVDGSGVTAPISPRHTLEDLTNMITWQEETLAKRQLVPEPELKALIGWLRSNLPTPGKRGCLIHGDAAFSNIIVDDEKITAVLDWEASHVGNAAEELAYLRPSIEPLVPWAEFVNAYEEAGGTAPDDRSLQFYTVWAHTWRYIGCLWLKQTFDRTGMYEYAVAAYVNGPRFLQDAVDAAFPAS